ncbi:WD40-repeat-containing domain protein [Limtongia smithiae]|uniref:WD40-repeat-containing domain protein n=1 Tax=Limtongia smithiae TaxID=1125753 RepID=UPI0034D004CF
MFVLPPPPKFPVGSPSYAAALQQMRENGMDAHNTLKFPTGDDCVFNTGEGQYTLRNEIHLATPPPHPSDVPVLNPNPLSTAPAPVTAGLKLSLCTVKYRNDTAPTNTMASIFRTTTTNTYNTAATESGRKSAETEFDDGLTEITSRTFGSSYESSSMFSEVTGATHGAASGVKEMLANAVVQPPSARESKRRKPKNSIAKSSSSFVSRNTPHEHLAKRLSERHSEDLYFFANINRSFNWMDFASQTLMHEPLSKILFTKAHPISHDVNQMTKSSQHIDVVIGFSTADVMWYDPMSVRYNRLNKNGTINPTAAADMHWIPGSENLFMAGHMNGAIVIYDKEKEDSNFNEEMKGEIAAQEAKAGSKDVFRVIKSIHGNQRIQKLNPVAYWKVSRKPITAFAFSPDCQHIAVVSEDGYLKIIDFVRERLVDVFSGYYGGLLCVCWSPDGRYILTGGQDDLVSIWSFTARALVARCQGHQSFVRNVAFDPWRCDERVYRFGSVGDDCRLLLWDFSVKSLHRPRGGAHRGSVSSHYSAGSRSVAERPLLANPGASTSSLAAVVGRQRADSSAVAVDEEEAYHPIASRASIPIIPPVMSKQVDTEPLTGVHFREDCVIVTCQTGHIKTWNRPGVVVKDGAVVVERP